MQKQYSAVSDRTPKNSDLIQKDFPTNKYKGRSTREEVVSLSIFRVPRWRQALRNRYKIQQYFPKCASSMVEVAHSATHSSSSKIVLDQDKSRVYYRPFKTLPDIFAKLRKRIG